LTYRRRTGDRSRIERRRDERLGRDPLVLEDQVHEGVDQREVRERLREVPEVTAGVRFDLLGIQQERAREGQQLLAQGAGTGELPDVGESRDQPERADREGPFLTGEAVIGLLDAVAQDEVVFGEFIGDGQHGRLDALVLGRQESDQRYQQQRSVERLRVVVLAEDAAVIGAFRADIRVNLVRRFSPPGR